MTKLAAIVALFVIAIVVAAGAYTLSTMVAVGPSAQDLTTLSARREDLLASQLQIEQQLSSINQSVQAALAQQQLLDAQVTKLAQASGSSVSLDANATQQATAAAAATQALATPVAAPPASTPAVQTPVYTPPPYIPPSYTPPVTRAS